MNEQDHITLQRLREAVDELKADDQQRVQLVAAQLRAVVNDAGDHGLLSLALVAAELQVARV